MADITAQLALTTQWQEVTAGLALVDGDTYTMDIVSARSNALAFSADTDSNVAPTNPIIGHPWDPAEPAARAREYTRDSAVYTWVRLSRGTATLVATKV